MKNQKNVHVVPHNGKWATRTEGNSRVSKTFDKQSDAIGAGKDQATKNNSELLIHGRNGQIREKNSHGSDPKDIKG